MVEIILFTRALADATEKRREDLKGSDSADRHERVGEAARLIADVRSKIDTFDLVPFGSDLDKDVKAILTKLLRVGAIPSEVDDTIEWLDTILDTKAGKYRRRAIVALREHHPELARRYEAEGWSLVEVTFDVAKTPPADGVGVMMKAPGPFMFCVFERVESGLETPSDPSRRQARSG